MNPVTTLYFLISHHHTTYTFSHRHTTYFLFNITTGPYNPRTRVRRKRTAAQKTRAKIVVGGGVETADKPWTGENNLNLGYMIVELRGKDPSEVSIDDVKHPNTATLIKLLEAKGIRPTDGGILGIVYENPVLGYDLGARRSAGAMLSKMASLKAFKKAFIKANPPTAAAGDEEVGAELLLD